jgi:hypothetical protein
MADYAPLLRRAIAGLPDQDPARRQAIYRRAREALERQLRGIDPPLGDAEILEETLTLEDVIRQIEADFAEKPSVEPAPDQVLSLPPDEAPPPEIAVVEPRLTSPKAAPVQAAASPAITPRLPEPPRPKMETRAEQERARRRLGLLAVIGAITILMMGTLAYLKREDAGIYRSASPALAQPDSSGIDPEAGKREGRLGPSSEPAATVAPVTTPSPPVSVEQRPAQPPPPPAPVSPLPITSRAFVVLEVPGGAPNQFEGQANWSFALENASRDRERSLRARVDFPGPGLQIELTFARNSDSAIRASHTILVTFDTKQALPPVREMSAIEWREREGQAGQTMSGLLVPIQDNNFLIGLDPGEAALQRNLDLLRTQRWLVFEVRLANGRRGAFLVEKGSSGERAVGEALTAWK